MWPTVHVNKGNISTRKNHALSHNQAQTTSTSSDNTNTAIKREAGESRLHELSTSTQDWLAGRQFMLFRMLDFNVSISARVAARLVASRWDVVQIASGGERRPQRGRDNASRSVPQHGSKDGLSGSHCCDDA